MKAASEPALHYDDHMHLRWERELAGRRAGELRPAELRRLAEDGVPPGRRLEVWPEWFTVGDLGRPEDLQRLAPGEAARQISLDVHRTQPLWLCPEKQAALQRVLCAYAALHPSVGYCQGMNNVAAVFITLGFDESTALRGLASLVQSCCPGYHDAGLWGYLRDAKVLGLLTSQVLPADVHERLDALGVPLDVLASDHFITLASHSWPLAATAQLWDMILLDGPPAVFASFMALLQLYLPEDDQHRLAGAIPGVVEDALEPVDAFRQAVQRGLLEDLPTILRQVRRLAQLVPQALIDEVRATVCNSSTY